MKSLAAVLGVLALIVLVGAGVLGFTTVQSGRVDCGSAIRPKSFSLDATSNTASAGGVTIDIGKAVNALDDIYCGRAINSRRNVALVVAAAGVALLLAAAIPAVRAQRSSSA